MSVARSAERLAVDGGRPVRATLLPYGRQSIDDADVAAVVEALRSDYLTTGPRVAEFERRFAETVGAPHAVAVSNGTAALHAIAAVLGVGPGDEVIVPALTFAATANCVVYQGAKPVFADVDPMTLLLDPVSVEARITPRTRAIIAVDYAGQPCDYARLRAIADARGLALAADGCHALGAREAGVPVGRIADLTAFSLHPVKHITTGEGGVVTTASGEKASALRRFRNHGIDSDHRERETRGSWQYNMVSLGYNYRLTDFQCALGMSQLHKLPDGLRRRREIARRYDGALDGLRGVHPIGVRPGVEHAYHLYVVRLDARCLDRGAAYRALRAEGIGVNVHYMPVHLHPYYRERFGTGPGLCPAAEAAYEEMLSLPMFPAMTEKDVDDVVTAVTKVARGLGR
ncbi:MAG TPA: UDP-4-amino-4,6-dideoxy-N-acetyl-beta-L-altrosamine transaminase [Thermoanaerobaculia bacterium]|nr:UDP-4-amino-4,6-dideoxy-N-acetyl-beta-L-altrosamine transaminase [Thermoanaerobaculia bacterium]